MLDYTLAPAPLQIQVRREYPELQTVGADTAIPLRWVTLKAESAWFSSGNPRADEYVLYVVQGERQWREWLFVGGYTGEYDIKTTGALSFDPERGLAKSIVGRASWTIDTRRSLAVEAVERQNGEGFYGKFEYSQMLGEHWRITPQVGVIHGSDQDFLGPARLSSALLRACTKSSSAMMTAGRMRLWRFGPTSFYSSIISQPIRRLDHTDRKVPTFSIVDQTPNRAADDLPLFLRSKLSVGADRT